jgi:alkylation response protein AidB-like acyl-CoA dehydrogenase
MIIGEGANEIQKLLVARQLVDRYGERPGALTGHDGEPAERRQLLLAVRQVVDKELAPLALEHDAAGRLPAGARARLAELGVLGSLAPGELGGLGLDLPAATLLVEELGRGWGALGMLLTLHLAATRAVARAAARERWVPAMTRGELLAVPVAGAALRAAPADGGLRLDGTVPLVPGAAGAGLLVLRLVDGRAACVPAASPGLTVGPVEPALGLRGLGPAPVRLEGVRVPAEALVEPWDSALVESFRRLGTAAVAVGIAQAAFEAALRYAQQRVTFGKPIAQHQAIQLKLADMARGIAAARLLARRAAERLEADAADMAGAVMARAEATETAAAVTLEAMRIHGGYGYTTEFPVERHYRDAAVLLADAAA